MCETAEIPDWLAAMVRQAREDEKWPNGEFPTLASAVIAKVNMPYLAPDDGILALIQMLINEVERRRREVDALVDATAELGQEVERLRSMVEIVEFLQRPDIHIMTYGLNSFGVVVHHEDNLFEGNGPNVISAAHMARHMERKMLADKAREAWHADEAKET